MTDVELFKSLFKGRADCYGVENTNIKEALTDNVIRQHLAGQRRIGVYMMLTDSVYFACIDVDREDRDSVAVEDTKEILNTCQSYGLGGYVEKSKRKGYHVWFFFSDLVKASKVRAILNQIESDNNIEPIEIFPKQAYVDVNDGYGNFVNLPLFKTSLAEGKTAFIDPLSWKPYTNQWQFLSAIKRISPKEIDDIITLGVN